MTSQELLQTAAAHHQGGRLDEAQKIYTEVLNADPNDAEALHLMGLLVSQRGDPATGRKLVQRAIELRPNADVFHVNFGSLSAACGYPEDAVAGFQKAIDLNRNSPPIVYAELGQALAALGRFTDAVHALEWAMKRQPMAEWLVMLSEVLQHVGRQQDALDKLQQAIQLQPNLAEARGALGRAMERENRLAEAERCYRDAITIKPELFQAHNNLGNVLNRQGRWAEAEAPLRKAIELVPSFPPAHYNLGFALHRMSRLDDALTSYQRAAELNPQVPIVWESLGTLLMERRQLAAAVDALRQATALRPSPITAASLGRALGGMDQFDEALAVLREAADKWPENVDLHLAAGTALQWCGELDEALAAFRRAVVLDPKNFVAQSHWLYAMLFNGSSPDEIYAAHTGWARQHTGHIPRMALVENDPSLTRRLRIGYVSPNFRNQAVMSFLLPIIENHDRGEVDIYCYSDTRATDSWTERLRRRADHWRDTANVSDYQLTEDIRKDRIDILVDLTGHIGDGRLRTFAAKPAPVEISYIGYQATTGLSNIDYFLSDDWATPIGQAEQYFAETVWRLPETFFCYQPPEEAPEVAALPAEQAGFITFGCQNNLAKVTPKTLALWCRVLAAVPDSRMILLTPNCREVDERIRSVFTSAGIPSDRLELVRRATPHEYLDRYNRIDIALDPVPFNGHTTTCDAAWMGCPTIMLAGLIFPYRYGGSVLRNVGLSDLISGSEDEYVRIAAALAADRSRLAGIRSNLREIMRRSPTTDGPRFTKNLESAYRQMWKLCIEKRS